MKIKMSLKKDLVLLSCEICIQIEMIETIYHYYHRANNNHVT